MFAAPHCTPCGVLAVRWWCLGVSLLWLGALGHTAPVAPAPAPTGGSAGGPTPAAPRVVLATVVGTYSPERLAMLRLTAQTGLFQLGPRCAVAVAAHSSWQAVPTSDLFFVTHWAVVPDAAFFAPDHPPPDTQAAANRLRLPHLLPQVMEYDIALVLDPDTIVLANVLDLIGVLPANTVDATHESHPMVAGQLVFRPSSAVLRHLQHAYRGAAQRGLPVSNALQAAFRYAGRVRPRLTHLVADSPAVCDGDGVAGYALVHCANLSAMQRAQRHAWHRHRPERHPVLIRIHEAITANVHRIVPGNPFQGMGHIGEVPYEVLSYAKAVRLPGVRQICEVGFNAGHSAAISLFSNPDAAVTVFDLGTLPWSAASVAFLRQTFPEDGRLTYIINSSQVALPQHAEQVRQRNAAPCDVLLADGDHSYPGALADFENGRAVSAPHGLLFADDATDSFPGVGQAWREMVERGQLETLYCTVDPVVVGGYQKGWCLGRYKP